MPDEQHNPTFVVEGLPVQQPANEQSVRMLRLRAPSPADAVEQVGADGYMVVRVHLVERGHLKVRSWNVEPDGSLQASDPMPDSLLLRHPILTIAIGVAVGIVVGTLVMMAIVATFGGQIS